LFLLVAPLVLSAYTHLWNPAGFPDIFFDEGTYMRRAMNILDSGNPQEAYFYDHPFFGQMVLSGVLRMTGHPDSLDVSTEASSLETLYMLPRVFMGKQKNQGCRAVVCSGHPDSADLACVQPVGRSV